MLTNPEHKSQDELTRDAAGFVDGRQVIQLGESLHHGLCGFHDASASPIDWQRGLRGVSHNSTTTARRNDEKGETE